MISADHVWILAIALVLDGLIGDPDFLWRRIPHPVAWIGGLIALLDRALNSDRAAPGTRKAMGVIAIAVVVLAAAAAGFAIERGFSRIPHGWIGTAVVASVFLAARSLYEHVAEVAAAFTAGGVVLARKAVSRIVGRDATSLDEAGVARAAIESTAENFSDGVLAPALWFALLGLPGLIAYKAINTADSMIGHLTPRHRDFGWGAARLDDVVNWPAGRLSGALIAIAAPFARGSLSGALAAMRADARRHRSPNAGWPEAAMAGALGVALAGPRRYRGVLVDDPFLNAGGRRRATPDDIRRGLRVMAGGCVALLVVLLAGSVAVIVWGDPQW